MQKIKEKTFSYRVVLTQNTGWDDVFIVIFLAAAIVCSSLVTVGIHYCLGMHLLEIPDQGDRTIAFKYTIIAPNFSVVSITTGKTSVILFLLRLMGQAATKTKRSFLYVLTIVSIIVNVMCIFVLMGFCIPAEKIWNSSTPGHCMSLMTQLVIGLLQASYNAFTDLALAIFPVFIFSNVQLPVRTKLTIIGVMGAGVLAAAATSTS
ncbi:hypothetical protein SI65_03782 [Aspergillus cristatus]|uniref:Rhodopsin domain-containing protein n=1 Tax=Aspergillus cristatus TaxID=573508 RepID=A0A1E3BIF6_ASPCR|nr:hypothetical protein SI65_03782 [Aspergillus cristatus]